MENICSGTMIFKGYKSFRKDAALFSKLHLIRYSTSRSNSGSNFYEMYLLEVSVHPNPLVIHPA